MEGLDPNAALPPEVKLTIVYRGGAVTVEGPLDDQVLCYGLLQIAKDEICRYKDRQRAMMARGMTPGGVYAGPVPPLPPPPR